MDQGTIQAYVENIDACYKMSFRQSWVFIGRTDVEAKALILWPPDARSQLIGTGPDAGKEWRQEEKGTTEEMARWHHGLNGHEFEQGVGVGDEQGSLACCSPWDCKELDTTEQLNWTELNSAYKLNKQGDKIQPFSCSLQLFCDVSQCSFNLHYIFFWPSHS